MATKARKSVGREQSKERPKRKDKIRLMCEAGGKAERVGGGGVTARQEARMRRCLIHRQGASPLRPRPPFPGIGLYGSQKIRQGFASRTQKRGAPLTDFLAPEAPPYMRERGPVEAGTEVLPAEKSGQVERPQEGGSLNSLRQQRIGMPPAGRQRGRLGSSPKAAGRERCPGMLGSLRQQGNDSLPLVGSEVDGVVRPRPRVVKDVQVCLIACGSKEGFL